jgi:hypothetical protein
MDYVMGGGEKVTIQSLGIESSEIAPKSLVDQVRDPDQPWDTSGQLAPER